jgi:hypothetical protein
LSKNTLVRTTTFSCSMVSFERQVIVRDPRHFHFVLFPLSAIDPTPDLSLGKRTADGITYGTSWLARTSKSIAALQVLDRPLQPAVVGTIGYKAWGFGCFESSEMQWEGSSNHLLGLQKTLLA